jgi:hypothetical protein
LGTGRNDRALRWELGRGKALLAKEDAVTEPRPSA